jgi:hypothetical protein
MQERQENPIAFMNAVLIEVLESGHARVWTQQNVQGEEPQIFRMEGQPVAMSAEEALGWYERHAAQLVANLRAALAALA